MQVIPSQWGETFGEIGDILGQALQQRREKQQQRQYGSILAEALGDPEKPLEEGLAAAIQRGVPVGTALEYGRTVQKARGDKDIGKDEVSRRMQGLGMPPEISDQIAGLWEISSVGGRTELLKHVVDKMSRGEWQFEAGEPLTQTADVEAPEEGFVFPEVDLFQGLTPKEKVQKQRDLRKENAPEFKESKDKIKSLKGQSLRVQQLERLNESKKLPAGLGRINVKDNQLRLPFAANQETQLWVKIVNDFTTEAKDSYGARVTNFDLQQFMRRLPGLSNSEEGRRLILEQLKVQNELDQLYHDSLKEVYQKYGLDNIDSVQADSIAEQLRADKEQELLSRYERVIETQDRFEIGESAREKGKVAVQAPDGTMGVIKPEDLDEALRKGFKKI